MRSIGPTLILLLVLVGAAQAADTLKTPYDPMWYADQYPFITYKGSAFTFESEFLWPSGYRRLDSTKLTPYQFWVSNFPLWHRDKGVASLARGMVLKAGEISRGVHLPWRTAKFYDCVIPLQMLAEYMLRQNRPFDLAYVPKRGDPITYGAFLKSEILYDSYGGIIMKPSTERAPNDSLFNVYMDLVATNTNYRSLELNCDPVSDSAVLPGDLLIGRDSVGLQGKVYSILLVVANQAGDRRYIVGTGCSDGCDFYIPLLGDDRKFPWLTLSQLKDLVNQPVVGFFRPRVPAAKTKS